ncbi:APC family permease [Amycolatopsis sp. NPDC003676]
MPIDNGQQKAVITMPTEPVDANLKRSISLFQAVGVSFHQVVGGGVVALMGTAIALTGAGAPIAFALAALAVIVYSLPIASLGSAMPVTGGRYTYAARLVSPGAGFASMWLSAVSVIQLSLMALAGANYVSALVPGVPVRPLAIALITVFFLTNLAGATFSSRVGLVLAVVMLAAFLLYGIAGAGQVRWSEFGNLTPHGIGGLLNAAAMLTFATTGAFLIADIGGEMKRPGRDIPLSVVGGTLVAAVIYVIVAIPSVGVLGAEASAGKPMSDVARHILSPGGFAFFILGGAMASVIGHINSLLLAATKPVLAATGDGWLPAGLGAVNRRFGTPHWLLAILYLIGVVPVLAGFSVANIAAMTSIVTGPLLTLLIIASWRVRRLRPELHAAAPFRMRRTSHAVLSVLGVAILGGQTWLLLKQITPPALLALAAWSVLGFGVWLARRSRTDSFNLESERV